MFITTSKSPFLSVSSSDSEDDLSPFQALDLSIHHNENYQSSLRSMLQTIDSRLHVNNLKLDLYDFLKKQKKSSYKRRFWYDQIIFYPFDDEADKIPEPLRVLKLIRSQQKKRNISHFLTKIMQEIDENVEDFDEELFINDNTFLPLPKKPIKSLKSQIPIHNFIISLPKKDPKEINWLSLAKKANTELLKPRIITESEEISTAKEPVSYNNNPFYEECALKPLNDIIKPISLEKTPLITGLQLYKSYMSLHKLFNLQASWTKEDDEILSKAVLMHGCEDWKQIANYLDGKDTGACFQRWYKYVNPSIRKGKWTILEDIKLALYLEFYGKGKWSIIAKKFANRTDVQIRERWCNILEPFLKNGNKWRTEEDEILLKEAPLNGFKWSVIAGKFKGRTDNQCTRRYKKLTMKQRSFRRKKQREIKKEKERITIIDALAKKLPVFTIVKMKKKEEEKKVVKTENH